MSCQEVIAFIENGFGSFLQRTRAERCAIAYHVNRCPACQAWVNECIEEEARKAEAAGNYSFREQQINAGMRQRLEDMQDPEFFC